jgi:predicted secreted Zn-dependent protease
MPLARWLAGGLSLLLVSGCMGLPEAAPSSPPAGSVAATPSTGPDSSKSPRPSASATPAPAADGGPITGIWRVRKVLAPGDRSALIPGTAYEDQAFYVSATCDREPCPTVEVKITPLGRASPVTVAVLDRSDTYYESAAEAENEGPCLNDAGDRVTGGATVSSTMRLWAEKVRPAGTAVETTRLIGTQTLDVVPTAIGEAAGCARQTASYDLTGRLASTVGRVEPAEPDQPPNTAGGVASLPSIGIKVSGVKIVYFPIEGDTLDELIGSLARGGVSACGAINYEWHSGDDRPAACTITAFNELEEAVDRTVGSTGKCAITRAEVKPRFTIHFPRWTAPETVPKRLLAWWREVAILIRDHEAGHVRISRNHIKTLNADLLGATCLQANRIIREWAAKLSDAHEEYDRTEYALPWPEPPAGY